MQCRAASLTQASPPSQGAAAWLLAPAHSHAAPSILGHPRHFWGAAQIGSCSDISNLAPTESQEEKQAHITSCSWAAVTGQQVCRASSKPCWPPPTKAIAAQRLLLCTKVAAFCVLLEMVKLLQWPRTGMAPQYAGRATALAASFSDRDGPQTLMNSARRPTKSTPVLNLPWAARARGVDVLCNKQAA